MFFQDKAIHIKKSVYRSAVLKLLEIHNKKNQRGVVAYNMGKDFEYRNQILSTLESELS